MAIDTLTLKNFRNLLETNISFSPHLNLVTGLNASGKTSLLESIYYLSTGRSFRSRRLESVINNTDGITEFVLFGKMIDSVRLDARHTVGIKRSTVTKAEIRLNGENISTASHLAKLSPTLVIDPLSFELLNGAPKVRRQFLDWGVFHVEPSFAIDWNNYIYCLKQRNTILRNAKIDGLQLKIWNQKSQEYGEKVHASRERYAEAFIPRVEFYLECFSIGENIKVKYYKGWEQSKNLSDFLEHISAKDIEKRYTQYGPHRADIKVTVGGKSAHETLSRGQQKLFVIAMYLAHIQVLMESTSKHTVVLIDDVAAELDQHNLSQVFKYLKQLDTQIICTVLDLEGIQKTIDLREKYNMFHVEHGKITVLE